MIEKSLEDGRKLVKREVSFIIFIDKDYSENIMHGKSKNLSIFKKIKWYKCINC